MYLNLFTNNIPDFFTNFQIIGVTLTYFIVLLQFQSSHDAGTREETIAE